MGQKPTTNVVVEAMLAGETFTPESLASFVSDHPREDLHLEYKDGRELVKPDPARTLREYVSAFANSAGGLLLVGIEDATRAISGCKAPGGSALDVWASRCLTGIAPFLSPPPRIHVVHHDHGDVLAVVTARAPALVPVSMGGRLAYFLRLGDQTLQAPDYLISDLVLGHRQHPTLVPRIRPVPTPEQLDLEIEIVNEGISWAHNVTVGVVAFVGPGVPPRHQEAPVALRAFIDAGDRAGTIVHASRMSGSSTAPFTSYRFGIGGFPAKHLHYVWRAALYVLTEKSPPTWYQLDFDNGNRPDGEPVLVPVPATGGLPVVRWDPKKR